METFYPADPHLNQPYQPQPQNHKRKYLYIALGVLAAAFLVFGSLYVELVYLRNAKIISPLGDPKRTGNSGNIFAQKVIMNPLTGVMYTQDESRGWAGNRPLAVMINNHPDARPQSALADADFVYEIVAEGGITRFLAFFLTNNPTKIGPVRSTREYYLVLVKELGDAMLMHIGYSPQALIDIDTWPVRSLFRGGATFWRDTSRDVAIEHTAYVNAVDLRAVGDNLGWGGSREIATWKFKDDTTKYALLPTGNKIGITFWYPGDFSVVWKYNAQNNTYERYMGLDANDSATPHVDNETKQQITAKNVVIQFASELSIPNDDKNRLDYKLIGSGQGLVFVDGHVIKATWSKASRDVRTMFYDSDGKEVEFNRGNIWVEIVPDRNLDQVTQN